MENLLLELEISFDGEKHWSYNVILFHVYVLNPIWYGLI